MANITIKQVKSNIGIPKATKKVLFSLGLRGIGSIKVSKDNNCIRGMVNKIAHLVEYKFENK